MVEAGEKGLVWDDATFVEYVQDPTNFLKTYLDDPSAKGKMIFKLTSGMEDVVAYLKSVAPGS
jgi:cytochrome c